MLPNWPHVPFQEADNCLVPPLRISVGLRVSTAGIVLNLRSVAEQLFHKRVSLVKTVERIYLLSTLVGVKV